VTENGIRVCFCGLDGTDASDPGNHEPGCIGASMLAMERARKAAGWQWTPMRNRLQRQD